MRKQIVAPIVVLALLWVTGTAEAQVRWGWDKVLEGMLAPAFALNPLNSDNVYAISDGKLRVSYDAGVTWHERGEAPPGASQLRTLVMTPTDTNVFLATGPAASGLWRSDDAGQSWTNVLAKIVHNGEAMAYDPLEPERFYCADFNTGEFYVSSDTGQTWTLRASLDKGAICSLSPHPRQPGLLIASAFGSLYRTSDGGATWTRFDLPVPDSLHIENPKTVWDSQAAHLAYATGFGFEEEAVPYALFRSADTGATWSRVDFAAVKNWGMSAHPVTGEVYTGGVALRNGSPSHLLIFKTYDHGKSWQQIGHRLEAGYGLVWSMAVSQTNRVFVNNGESLYRHEPLPSGRLTGRVLDEFSRLPLPTARVYVFETGDSVLVTNPEGWYTLTLLPGTYNLEVRVDSVSAFIEDVSLSLNQVDTLDLFLRVNLGGGAPSETFAVGANYPNPFNAATNIPFELPVAGRVRLTVYNLLGQRIRVVEDGPFDRGRYIATWDGLDDDGAAVPNGIYFYRLEVTGSQRFEGTRKMLLLR